MKRLIAPTVALLTVALAGVALAGVLIYHNDFSSKKQFKQIHKLQGGGKCKSEWKGKKAFGTRVNKGDKECLFGTPVEGDSKQSNLTIQAVGKVLKKSHKKVRSKIYVGVAARASRRSGYEIRIFPAGRKYKLLRNGDQIVGGKSKAISALDERNKIRLAVEGRSVVAKVNGKRVASFEDDSPEQVVGRRTALIFGSMAKANKDGFGLFDAVRAYVPSP